MIEPKEITALLMSIEKMDRHQAIQAMLTMLLEIEREKLRATLPIIKLGDDITVQQGQSKAEKNAFVCCQFREGVTS